MKSLIFINLFIVFSFYFSLYWYDWHIEHNGLNIKKVKPNKYLCPISWIISKRKGRYVKLELLYIITEIYAHLYLIVSTIVIYIIIINENMYWLSKYLFFGSIAIELMIDILYIIISKVKRKTEKS